MALVAIGLATLTPGTGAAPPICLGCSGRAAADVIRNVLLYVPLGVALGGRDRAWSTAFLLATAFSVTAEITQLVIPGRDPDPTDVLFNGIGGFVGFWLDGLRHRWWIGGRPTWSGRATAASVGVMLSGLALATALQPDLTPGPWWIQPNPEFQDVPAYGGRVRSVAFEGTERLAGVRFAPHALRNAFVAGEPLLVEFEIVTAPTAPSTLIALADTEGRSLLSVLVVGDDLHVHYRMRADGWRLDRPFAVFPNALRDRAVGTMATLRVGVAGEGGAARVQFGRSPAQIWQPQLRELWALIMFPPRTARTIGWLLGALTAALPFALLGLMASSGRAATLAAVVTAAAAVIGASSADLGLGLPDLVAAGGGFTAARFLRVGPWRPAGAARAGDASASAESDWRKP